VIGFVARRVLLTIPILLGVSIVVFIMIKIIPGDPVASLLGVNSTPQARAMLTHRLGLDKPLPVQYLTWLWHTLQGDLGTSIAQQMPARSMVVSAFWNTLLLTAFAAIVAIGGGVILGAIGAFRRGKPSAAVSSGISLFSVSAPQYSVGLILMILFAVQHPWFPSGGMHDVTGNGGFVDLLRHLVLPGITAALIPMGIVARMFRSTLLDVMNQDWMEALRARGLSQRSLTLHAFHNTLPGLLTIAGLQLGYLLGGVVFVETIYSWPGLGLLVYQSITQRDLPVIEAGVLVAALAFVVLNLVVDIAHAAIDPRYRH
jgi:peptide/nickel transport system permease protein